MRTEPLLQELAVFVTQGCAALDALSRVVMTDKRLSFSLKVFSNSNEDFPPKLTSVASLTNMIIYIVFNTSQLCQRMTDEYPELFTLACNV